MRFLHYSSVSACYANDVDAGYYSSKELFLHSTHYTDNCIGNFIFYVNSFKTDPNKKELINWFINYINDSNKPFAQKKRIYDEFLSFPEIKSEYDSEKIHNYIYPSIEKIEFDKNNNNILFYTGYMHFKWNDTSLKNKCVLGGSEKAVIYLSRQLPKQYNIYIAGDQEEETIDNIKYIPHDKLQFLLNNTKFHSIIVSRYISFFYQFTNIRCHKLLLMAHDTYFVNHHIKYIDHTEIISNITMFVDNVICLTNWHKDNYHLIYPCLKNENKIITINNGINISNFNFDCKTKIKNKFIWSSCSGRGLHTLLNIWDNILEIFPDATLDICSYDPFPKTNDDNEMKKIIDKHDSISHHDKLPEEDLYDLISRCEFWLYTTNFHETSCITAMEMLMSEVICLYYPLAGLNDTLGNYGIPVKQGEEIKELLNLTTEKKALMREKGKEYALSCSWKNRAQEWSNVLELNKKKWIFYCFPHYERKMIQQYIDNLNYIYPQYNIHLTNDKNRILTENPSKITFVYGVFDQLILNELPNTEFSFLNTEPLNISIRLEDTINILKLYPNFEYYDYSKSNLKILEENGFNIQNKIYLPYKCSDEELEKLINLNKNTEKEFDLGILKALNGDVTDRRLKIVDFLKENNYTINIISGWGNDRDIELAKCKTILNIHGFYQIPSNMFEHIRCDRLLEAGFNILSETSYKLDEEFTNKYPNLKQISYDDFLNIDVINERYNNESKQTIKKIYDTLCLNKNPFDYYLNPVDIYEHLPTLYKYASKCNSVLECGVRASVSSWALAHGLINNNSDNKKLILNDIEPCDVSKLLECTKSVSHLDVSYEWISDLDINLKDNVDLTFIDTWHVGGHLKKELAKFNKVTNKYIIMHDTTIDEFTSEAIRAQLSEERIQKLAIDSSMSVHDVKMGLWTAIEDFLKNNSDWVLDERFTNNNGLTILKKVYNKPKIIDCFTFYNELEMLNYRLNILNDVVDYFVLVEATHTHVGKEKPLFYQDNKHLFEKFNHKIIHIIVDDFTHKFPNINIEKEEQWINERYQRDCISRGIDKLSLQNNDVITITDLDEIPNPKILEQIKNKEITIDINIIEMDLYYYNLHSKFDGMLWYHAKILTFKKYNELNIGCGKIRFYNCPIIKNAGWHLSYFGNEKFIKNKLENFTHQEFNKIEFTDEKLIKERINNGNDLFDRPTSIINIPIEDNDNLPPYYDIYLTNFYKIQLTQTNKNIGFFIRHFSERGTEVSTYDYAHYNEIILQNKSYIIHFSDDAQKKYGFPDVKDSFPKFNSTFEMIEINDITDLKDVIEKYKLDFFYTQTHGGPDIYQLNNNNIWGNCKTIKHCVFDTTCNEGGYYLSISNHLNQKNKTNIPVIPYMVDLPNTDTHLRDELNIPHDAIVLGRYGGFHQFDLNIAHNAIKKFLNINKTNNVYFLFMNTVEFYHHENIIYLDKNIDLLYKTNFINTCDAMIHARSDGETFGLAIAEFSIKNKPIITCPCGDLEHILLLGDKAITYNNTEELLDIFSNIKELFSQHSDWNCYREYTPEKVMDIFDNILSNYKLETNIVTINNVEFKFFKDDDLAKSSIALNIHWEPHITSFVEYYNKYFPIQNIIDIGANFGYHSLLFSKYVKNKVFSFEPQEQNYNLLSFNINFNNIKNICSYKMACGEENDTIKMPIVENYNNSINMGDFTPNIINKHHFTYVKSVKLDDIDFPPIDIIKIDVQGWEKKVLKGSYNLLQHHKPILIIEFEEYQLNKLNESCKNLIEYIRENNYYIFYLDYKYPSDHICVHNDKLNEFKKCFNSVISTHTQDNNINHNILYNINEKIIIK
jgi:FkbM family methyltransferase